MYTKLNGREIRARRGDTWLRLLEKLPEGERNALGISIAGKTHSLTDKAEEYAYATTLTLKDEEGRRIYERSVQFLLLTAVQRIYPWARIRIQHSLGRGVYMEAENLELAGENIAAIRGEMDKLVEQDLPIRRYEVSTRDAANYFLRTNQTDRLRILGYRKVEHFTLYEIDGLQDYFYGVMVPSTGYTPVYDVVPYARGMVLLMPSEEDPARASRFRDYPKLTQVYAETAQWHGILHCRNVADLNDMIRDHRLREFIRVNEALHEKKIQWIADQAIDSGARVLLISGPSSSGKTTFAHRLSIALRVHGLRPVKLSLDDYYRNRDELPLEEDGTVDLERLDTLDTRLLCEHLPKLLRGEEVEVPTFDFKTGRRTEQGHIMRVEEGQPIIIEGIHGLNEALTASVPRNLKFKIYISALTMLNLDDHNRIRATDARLLRRSVRDNLFRGSPPEETMGMWASVRRGEVNYIYPFEEDADVMFNSALSYELPIMKKYAYPHLLAIQPESPYYTMARRLVKFLNYIQTADVEDEVPVNSILREFIGGCCFYREED